MDNNLCNLYYFLLKLVYRKKNGSHQRGSYDFSQYTLFELIQSYWTDIQIKIVGGSTSGGKLTLEIT